MSFKDNLESGFYDLKIKPYQERYEKGEDGRAMLDEYIVARDYRNEEFKSDLIAHYRLTYGVDITYAMYEFARKHSGEDTKQSLVTVIEELIQL